MVRDVVELRVDIDSDIAQLIDALVLARGGKDKGFYRGDIVAPVLREWAEKVMHESMMVQRVMRGKGMSGAERGQGAE